MWGTNSKEHEELEEYREAQIKAMAEHIVRSYCHDDDCANQHPEALQNITYYLKSASSLGWITGQSYMLREQSLWSKEDLAYHLADTIQAKTDRQVDVSDLAPKK